MFYGFEFLTQLEKLEDEFQESLEQFDYYKDRFDRLLRERQLNRFADIDQWDRKDDIR
jgi:hypothetical protein